MTDVSSTRSGVSSTDLWSRMARALSSGLVSRRDAPADDAALYAWVADHLGVRIPRRACCSEHRAPFDAFADAYVARSPIAAWVASRRFGGKSLLLATLALTEATTLGAGRHGSGLTKTRVRLANGGTMLAVAASTRAVRGPHPSRLRIDEADELSLAIFDAALGQTMAKGGVRAQGRDASPTAPDRDGD